MELTINITEAGEETVSIERGDAEAIPEPPHDEGSMEGFAAPEAVGRRVTESGTEAGRSMAEEPRAAVAPPMAYQPGGSPESPVSGTSVVAPPAHFSIRHGGRKRR